VTPDQRRELEGELRRLHDAGDLQGAMTAAVRGYGPELFAFLNVLTHDRDRAGDVFAALWERAWRGLPEFRWDCSFRVWAYTIARHEFLRSTRAVRRERKQVPLSKIPTLEGDINRIRTSTAVHHKSEVKEGLARLRETLEPDDHLLLALRVDRKMPWNDIARVLGTGEPEALTREAAALRKRYERVKNRLRDLARDA
jgi:RNA polymerase sigma-70 factor (ECF subfamily)